jgi:hypothetical protein
MQACIPLGMPNVCVAGPNPVTTCPTLDLATQCENDWFPDLADWTGEFEIVSGPAQEGDMCCYEAQVLTGLGCVGGRPFLVDEQPLTAPPQPLAHGWTASTGAPRVVDRSPMERAALAESWTREALAEHASIASFARFALELLAAGADAELVEAAHRAALDEIEHARLCFALASAYAGAPIGPGPIPIPSHVEVSAELADLAVRVAREGCVGETIAAVVAAERLEHTRDPAEREALRVIAADEARHAELAWRTVVWAIGRGGDAVRRAVLDALEEVQRAAIEPSPFAAVAALALRDVVGPAMRALEPRCAPTN